MCMYTCVRAHVCMHLCMWLCMRTSIHVFVCAFVPICVSVSVCVCGHVCMHFVSVFVHIHICMHPTLVLFSPELASAMMCIWPRTNETTACVLMRYSLLTSSTFLCKTSIEFPCWVDSMRLDRELLGKYVQIRHSLSLSTSVHLSGVYIYLFFHSAILCALVVMCILLIRNVAISFSFINHLIKPCKCYFSSNCTCYHNKRRRKIFIIDHISYLHYAILRKLCLWVIFQTCLPNFCLQDVFGIDCIYSTLVCLLWKRQT